MGLIKENEILSQAKKGQGETNVRLDAILAELKRTNDLLAQLVGQQTPGASTARH